MVGNRALDDPGAFGTEHNDALAVRDLGWMLNWVATAQEALDTALISWRVAEDPRVFLPCAISADGAFLTHSQQIVQVPDKRLVERFLPPYDRGKLQLHPDNPITIAPQVNEDWLMEMRKQSDAAMRRARGVIIEAYEDFNRIFGRDMPPFIEEYMTADAEVILVGMGTLGLPMRVAVRRLREEGQKVGFLRLKWFRPFPVEDVQRALSRAKAVGVVDRDYSFGAPFHAGVLYHEIRSAMYDADPRIPMVGFVAGLGGREITQPYAREMFAITQQAAQSGRSDDQTHWIGVRENTP